jgi:hypothetical protein
MQPAYHRIVIKSAIRHNLNGPVAEAALAAAKARGTKLGGYRWDIQTEAAKGNLESIKVRSAKAAKRAADLLPVIGDLKAKGAASLHQMAAGLNERGIKTARGRQWSAVQVQRVLQVVAA